MSTPNDLPAPKASRLRPPSWRDPRLLVGVLLVLTSVAVGARVVALADDTRPYYAAARALTAGDRVGTDDVRVVRLLLDEAPGTYLLAEADLDRDLVATRSIGAGELLPTGALGHGGDVALQPVGIPVAGQLAAGLVKGAVVDVWVASPDPDRAGTFSEPERVVDAATVSQVSGSSSALGASSGSTVQVLLEESALAEVLGALANKASVSLVLAPGQGG